LLVIFGRTPYQQEGKKPVLFALHRRFRSVESQSRRRNNSFHRRFTLATPPARRQNMGKKPGPPCRQAAMSRCFRAAGSTEYTRSRVRVVDTSVIIAVVGSEPQKAALIAQTQGAQLFAPASLPHEIGNALSSMLKRGRISLPQALAALAAFRHIALTPVDIDLDIARELSARLNICAYDADMIACALRLNALLLTLDAGLKAARRFC